MERTCETNPLCGVKSERRGEVLTDQTVELTAVGKVDNK